MYKTAYESCFKHYVRAITKLDIARKKIASLTKKANKPLKKSRVHPIVKTKIILNFFRKIRAKEQQKGLGLNERLKRDVLQNFQ